jgi:hypothetical protein
MNTIKSRRFDKYIELFGRPGDNRVTLLLGELEDIANARRLQGARLGYIQTDVSFDFNQIPPGMQNQNFINADPNRLGNQIHTEWCIFALNLCVRLNNRAERNPSQINIIKTLKNAAPGSVDEFMLIVLDKICTVRTQQPGQQPGQAVGLYQNKALLDNVVEIVYHSNMTIFDNLFSTNAPGNNVFLLVNLPNLIEMEITHQMMWVLPLVPGAPGAVNQLLLVPPPAWIDYARMLQIRQPHLASFSAFINTEMQSLPNPNQPPVKTYLAMLVDFIGYLDTPTNFGFNFEKYLKAKLFEAKNAKLPATGVSKFFDQDDTAENKYWRKADGTLWTTDSTGDVQVDISSQKYKDLKITDKCFGTNFKDGSATGGKSCGEYLRECLNGSGVGKCIEFLKDSKYWDVVQDEVDNMLPAMALKTLESFDFKIVEVYDETNKQTITKVITVTDWLVNLQNMVASNTVPGLDDQAYNAIAKNEKLKGYLGLLVKKVNTNPAILNPNITKSDEQRLNNPNAFLNSTLWKMGVKALNVTGGTWSPSSLERLANSVRGEQDAVRIRLMGPALFGNIMVGGSAQTDELESRIGSESKQTWALFKTHYLVLINQLKNHGKDIAKDDKDKINKLFEQLKNSETKLMQVLLMAEKYKDLIQIHGERDSKSQLTMDHLKQFVDQRNRYFTRVAKRQDDLISIIRSISDAVQRELPAGTASPATQVPLNIGGLV